MWELIYSLFVYWTYLLRMLCTSVIHNGNKQFVYLALCLQNLALSIFNSKLSLYNEKKYQKF